MGFYENGIITTDAVTVNLPFYITVSSIYEQTKGICIKTSSNKVSVHSIPLFHCNCYCYGYHPALEIFYVIPVTHLCVSEYKYYVLSVDSSLSHPFNSSVLVVGTEDNTIIKLTVTQPVTIIADNVITNLIPYKESSFTINRMQTVYFGSPKDLTGSKIITNKEVSVFSGHPYGQLLKLTPSYLIKQIPPTVLWGKVHYVMPLNPTSGGYAIKIVASDNCLLEFHCNSSSLHITLNNGGYIFKEFSNTESCAIKSTSKVLVAQFSLRVHTYNHYGSVQLMALVSPAKHYYSRFNFSFYYFNHIYVIVMPQYYQPDKIYLLTNEDNTTLDTQVWVPISVEGIIEAYATQVNITHVYGMFEIFHANETALMTVMLYGSGIFQGIYGTGIPNHIIKSMYIHNYNYT